jgi:hypothetical protein
LKAVRTAGPVIFTVSLIAVLEMFFSWNRQWFIDDGPVENFQVLLLLCVSAVFFYRYRENDHPRFKPFYLFFTIVFLVTALEELNYFQQVFGFENPLIIDKINNQKEFNLHNIDFLGFELETLMMQAVVFWVFLSLWKRGGQFTGNRIPLFEKGFSAALIVALIYYYLSLTIFDLLYPHEEIGETVFYSLFLWFVCRKRLVSNMK